ncbi:hypothetical protein MC885_015421 [Smutsia gigantea]|nr:hypothetical protein MC885_015421 [Smutsia gigantea]
MVPLGPKLVLSTSCSPRAAVMLTANAAWARATSALGFRVFTAAIADPAKEEEEPWRAECPEPAQCGRRRCLGLLEKSGPLGPPPACPRAAAIGPRGQPALLIGSRTQGVCGLRLSRPNLGVIAHGRGLFLGVHRQEGFAGSRGVVSRTSLATGYSENEQQQLLNQGAISGQQGCISLHKRLVLPKQQAREIVALIQQSLHIGPEAMYRFLSSIFSSRGLRKTINQNTLWYIWEKLNWLCPKPATIFLLVKSENIELQRVHLTKEHQDSCFRMELWFLRFCDRGQVLRPSALFHQLHLLSLRDLVGGSLQS